MKTTVTRYDAYYEVTFSRPAFSGVGSFAQILEPIHDALSQEFFVPSDAISLENGNTIASATVTATLLSGNAVFEARLDGFKAHFFDLALVRDTNRAKRCVMLFENAVFSFLRDGLPARWRIGLPSWLTVEGGSDVAEDLVRQLTWLPRSQDPFEIGATKTLSHVKFDFINVDKFWAVSLAIDKSALPDADLFVEVIGVYTPGSEFTTFEEKMKHILTVSDLISNKLGLIVE